MGSSSVGIGFVRMFLGFLEERVLKDVFLEGRDCGDGGVDGMVIGLFMIGRVLFLIASMGREMLTATEERPVNFLLLLFSLSP